jgi:hypothetical protein
MRSHFMLGRGLAMACAAAGATAIPKAVSAIPLASDNASNAAYSDGWQVGDNGGFGFGPWNMSGTYNTPVQHSLDSTGTMPYNQIGPSWILYNPDAPPGPGTGTDISQAGRAILGGLQPGMTLTTIIDNPTERRFFRGYTVRLNTGGGNTAFEQPPQSRLAIGTFEYFTNGKWYATGTGGDPNLFDTDTDAGLRIDVTLTSTDNFLLVMTPLDDPSKTFAKSGTLEGPAGSTIDWIEFELYNTDSDFFPTVALDPQATDFYIRSIEINAIPEPAATVWLLAATALAMRRRGRCLNAS